MVKFSEIINASIEWTGTLLFRPFKAKKWLILAFIALLAGAITGGCQTGSAFPQKEKPKKAEAASALQEKQSPRTLEEILNGVFRQLKDPWVRNILIVITALLCALIIVMMWLSSRFSFIFLESVIKNDASIKIPFRENKALGNSLFGFSLWLSAIFLFSTGALIGICIYTLIRMGVFNKLSALGIIRILMICLPFIFLLLALIIAASLVGLIVKDFVIVVMYKDKIKIMQAWLKVMAILKANKLDIVKYILIKIGLGLCSGIINSLLSVVGFIGALLPIGLVAGLSYVIYLILPRAWHAFYFSALTLLGAPALLFLFYCLMCLSLPFAVFFRTLSLKFMGRLDPHYNLFQLNQ